VHSWLLLPDLGNDPLQIIESSLGCINTGCINIGTPQSRSQQELAAENVLGQIRVVAVKESDFLLCGWIGSSVAPISRMVCRGAHRCASRKTSTSTRSPSLSIAIFL
jgi:hypothetical protein